MAQGRGNGLAPDSFAVTKSASADSGSESHENMDSLLVGDTDEELVELEAGAPVAPVFPVRSSGGVVHCGTGNLLPSSVEITLKLISIVGWTICHELVWGREEGENTSSNEVRNSSSDSEGCPRANPWWNLVNEREAVSAKRLCNPAQWVTEGRAAPWARCRMASARRS
jgi:hypothetical protein